MAETTYPKDAGVKLRRHATARVPIYWIVNLDRQVEVYTEPRGCGRAAHYHGVAIHHATARVPVVLDGQERGRIAVQDLLPP